MLQLQEQALEEEIGSLCNTRMTQRGLSPGQEEHHTQKEEKPQGVNDGSGSPPRLWPCLGCVLSLGLLLQYREYREPVDLIPCSRKEMNLVAALCCRLPFPLCSHSHLNIPGAASSSH